MGSSPNKVNRSINGHIYSILPSNELSERSRLIYIIRKNPDLYMRFVKLSFLFDFAFKINRRNMQLNAQP